MKQYLNKLINQQNLSLAEMKEATNKCFTDSITEAEIASFLTALQAKGETAEEITGMVEVIRSRSSFQTGPVLHAMDNCGTGGDQSYSFNISTTSAFVIAGAGVKIAKHGNRSISSRTGSADVLEHLGVSLSFSKEQVEEMLEENNIAFLFAPHVHAALKPFTQVRKSLGVPTIFNAIGPLTNPVNLETQLIGVYRKELLPLLAEAMHQLGRRRGVVVNGAGNMDEASLAGENHVIVLENGKQQAISLYPEDVGLPTYTMDDIRGGDSKENAEILKGVLHGKKGAYYDTVLLNAGLALFTNGEARTIREGVEAARESIESGAALERLNQLVEYSSKIPSEVL
ncbi:anthranilate phosphoribosyltransferase [Virgibacillus xinjiangensis]|uniref:Anthranilate phosphoribosyltransferase n=1 Tax=Virgibacillus xinjiangensis TaxID=393090 RepID=A0ABV7CZ55_9BACI